MVLKLIITILIISGCGGSISERKVKTYEDIVNSCLDDGLIEKELKDCIEIKYKK